MKPIEVKKRGNRFVIYYRVSGYKEVVYESFQTEEEAKARAALVTLEKIQGTLRPPVSNHQRTIPTLEQLLDQYVNVHGQAVWGDTNYSVVTRQIRDYIKPAKISKLLVRDIRTADIDHFLNDLLETPMVLRPGHKIGKTVGIATVEKIRSVLRSAFNQAIKWGYVEVNPVNSSTLPKVERKKRSVWTPSEAQRALSSCSDENLRLCMLLAIGCSLRIGEILGLQWENITLQENETVDHPSMLNIRQELKRCDVVSLEKTGSKNIYYQFPPKKDSGESKTILVLKSPKTASSVRRLYVPATIVAALKKHLELQNVAKQKAGYQYNNYDLVFAQPDGRPIEERFIQKEFSKLIEKNKLPKVVFHSLRHLSTSLKLQFSGGDIKTVQGDTGHAQANMVTDVYAHTFDDSRRLLAEKMDTWFISSQRKVDYADSNQSSDLKEFERLLLEKPEIAKSLLTLLKNA